MTAEDNPQERQVPRRLTRIRKDRKIAGVCTGFGAYFNVDPTIVRLLWLVLALAWGSGILLYLIAWIVMPLDNPDPQQTPTIKL